MRAAEIGWECQPVLPQSRLDGQHWHVSSDAVRGGGSALGRIAEQLRQLRRRHAGGRDEMTRYQE